MKLKLEEKRVVWLVPGNPPHLSSAETYCSMTEHGWTKVGEVTVEFTYEKDDAELLAEVVDGLNMQAKNIRVEAGLKCAVIEKQIASLLSLPYTPAADAPAEKSINSAEADDDIPF